MDIQQTLLLPTQTISTLVGMQGPAGVQGWATPIANQTLLGNNSGATAAPTELAPGAVRTMLGLGTADSPTFASLFIGGADTKIVRGATGPTIDFQAAGGIRSRNLAGNADAPITGSTGAFSGTANATLRIGGVNYGTTFECNGTGTFSGSLACLQDIAVNRNALFRGVDYVTRATIAGDTGNATFNGTITGQSGLRVGTASSNSPYLFGFSSNLVSTIDNAGRGVSLYTYNIAAGSYGTAITGDPFTATSGTSGNLYVSRAFTPTSGNGIYSLAYFNPTVNQTGGASGVTRCVYIAPSLTAAYDFRGLEIANCGSHKALVTGTGPVNFGDYVATVGSLGVGSGTSAPNAKFEVVHTATGMVKLNNTSTAADGVGASISAMNTNSDFLAGIYFGFSGGIATVNRKINFLTGGDSATPKMSLDGSGNLSTTGNHTFGSTVYRTDGSTGLGTSSAANVWLAIGGTQILGSGNINEVTIRQASVLGFSNTSANTVSGYDVNFNRSAAGTIRVGTTTTNALGSLSFYGLTLGSNVSFPGTAVTRTIAVGDTYGDGSELQILNGVTSIGRFNSATGFITGLNVQASGALCAGGFTPATYGSGYKLQVNGQAVVQGASASAGVSIFELATVAGTGAQYMLRASGNSTGSTEIYVQNSNTGAAKFHATAVSTGDAQIQFEVNGGTIWSMGLRQPDSSAFVLSKSSSLGTSNVFRVDATTLDTLFSSNLTWTPPATVTPASNGQLTVEKTSNTTLTFKLKGSDGTVRSGTITLA